MDWDYFDKFESVVNKYMEARGEGNTMASQIVTAVNKLIYKWYNDGDVFDNTYYLSGWWNDLSSYANWLDCYCAESRNILATIEKCYGGNDYENLLVQLANTLLNEELMAKYSKEKIGSIYECQGRYEFNERYDDDDEWDWE